MEDYRCFQLGCMMNVEYACPCSFPPVYTCELHAFNHLKTPNKNHALKPNSVEPNEKTREAILNFLAKCDAKHRKLKEKVLASFSQRFIDAEIDLKELIKEIDSYSDELNNCFTKIFEAKRITKSEQDSVLELLSLEPDEAIEKLKAIIPPNSDWYKSTNMLIGFNKKVEKMIDHFIENKIQDYLNNRLTKIENFLNEHNKSINLANNELASVKNSILNIINENNKSLRDFEEWKDKTKIKTENEIGLLNSQISSIIEDFNQKFKEAEKIQRNFRNIIELDLEEKSDILENSKNAELEKELKDTCSACESDFNTPKISAIQVYQDIVSSYKPKPFLYNLVGKNKRTNLLNYSTEIESQASIILDTSEPLGQSTCITQLPNGKLFCYGSYPLSGITLLIDDNYRVQELPPGTPCWASSAIYFNNNVYCFGGVDNENCLTLSSRFDLGTNQWNKLTQMPKPDTSCSSIIFNGSILIAGCNKKRILRYSIDSNSFSTIPYEFVGGKRKILIKTERLYLIECKYGSIYESEIGNDTAWRHIKISLTIDFDPLQIYFQYNKEGIYIGCINCMSKFFCFKFNLNMKSLVKLV